MSLDSQYISWLKYDKAKRELIYKLNHALAKVRKDEYIDIGSY